MSSDSNYGTGEPQALGTVEWMGYRFSELNEQDLFYFEENNLNTEQNPAFRKVGDNLALDLRNQTTITIETSKRVFQKEY
tara:strand:+ start:802 stop:1041 length:240 start_codon:yes stop_codon:yes gene_type:complete